MGMSLTVDHEALQWAEERLRLALDAARLGPWEWDIVSGQVFWSPMLEAIHGIPTGSFTGSFEAWKRDIHPDDLDRVLATVGEGLEKKTGHNVEYRIIRPDGAVRWLEVRSRLLCTEAGEPKRMLGVCMDVTERKQLEEAREMFIGILGHDLRNPLQAIYMAGTLLMRNAQLPPTLLKTAATVTRSADRMERMISDLLDFARGRFGQGIPVKPQKTSLESTCRSVVEELAIAYPDRALTLKVEGDTTGLWDPERVGQLVSNLVGNALTHGSGAVQVTLRSDSTAVVLEVANEGTPIEPENMTSLFQPFVSRGASRDGLGLGLFIASEIAKAHHGKIEVTSSVEDGTVFAVHWPRLHSAR